MMSMQRTMLRRLLLFSLYLSVQGFHSIKVTRHMSMKLKSSNFHTSKGDCDSWTRRSAILATTAGTLLMPSLQDVASAYEKMVSCPERSLFLSSFVPATSDDMTTDNMMATRLDVFNLGNMPIRKAKMAVQTLGDKYSRVVAARSMDPYDIIGVGLTLNQVERGGQIIISAPPREGSPADRAGLKYGDKVYAVNGRPTRGRNVFDVVEQVSENMDARTVTLTVEGAEDTDTRSDVVLTRDFTNVPDPVDYKVSERRPDGTVVGYIQLLHFNSITPLKMKEAIHSLKSQGANAFVIDVRHNGGGALQSALWTVKLFLGGDKVILNSVEGSKITPYRATKSNVLIDPKVPVIVLIDKGSASATEIFSSALRDNCRALVMGERSYGKGLIQASIGLEDGSRLIVTAGRYLRPNGSEIQGRGITPDIPGRGIIASFNKPGERSDTSKIDFGEVSTRLSSPLCLPPSG